MRETIEHIINTEKTAADILLSEGKKSAAIITKNDTRISENLNVFMEHEHNRYSEAVEKAELEKFEAIGRIRNENTVMKADLEAISDKVLNLIMKTVFD
ncbi:MAG: hypothetical protein JEZ04_02485 [Spirochaetales bacterium]|nr:hypothetical protein [Spirochaetales bacterium]